MTMQENKLPVTESLSGSPGDNISQLTSQYEYPSAVNVYSSDNVHVGPKNIYKGNVSITHIVLPDGKSVIGGSSSEQLDKLPENISNRDYICETHGPVFNISNGKIPSTSPIIRIETKDEKTSKLYQKKFMICASLLICTFILTTVICITKFGAPTKPKEQSATFTGGYNKGVLTLVEKSQWNAKPAVGKIDKLVQPIEYVLVEHTATYSCFTNLGCEILAQSIQDYHMNSGDIGDDIGYNFLIGGNGLVYEGRGWDTLGAHARGWNSVSVGVAFMGNFALEIPTPASIDALNCLLKEGVKLKKLSENYKLVDVAQLQSTLSPGKNVINVIKKDSHYFSIEEQSFVNNHTMSAAIENP